MVAPVERPRDIWVFRSVLDQRPRIVTIALHEDLWLAYDATHGGLYKAWSGDVDFEGAVYTGAHGPQPTSRGPAYFTNETGPEWTIRAGGQDLRPRYRGYVKDDGQVTLQYGLSVGRREAMIFETPEVRVEADGTLSLVRSFRQQGLPQGTEIWLTPNPSVPSGFENRSQMRGEGGRIGLSLDAPLDWVMTLGQPPAVLAYATLEQTPTEPETPYDEGLSLRVYMLEESIEQIPTLVEGQTPNYSVRIRNVDLSTTADFGGIEDRFYAEVSGFITIPTTGKYTFRIASDDGSRLRIGPNNVIDNDGLGSMAPKEGSVDLEAGRIPIRIEMFENEGGQGLRLEWRKPGDSDFELVPSSVLSTPAGEVRVTAPGAKKIANPGQMSLPGDGRPLLDVHPSFDLITLAREGFEPRVGGIDFLPDGRMVVCTWDADGAVYLVEGALGKADRVRVKRIAEGLAEPLGIEVVDGAIYVLQKQELTKLVDRDGDDVIDEYYALANGWGVTPNFHEFAFGLLYQKGYFYANLAIAIDPGGKSTQPQNPDRGKVLKIDAKTGDYEFIAQGLRTPNGIGFGVGGHIYITDNQGDWLPSSKLLRLEEGAFYGSRAVDPVGTARLKETPPVVWLPQGEIGNSPSQPAPIEVGPFKGQMLHGEVTHGGVKRVFVEEVGGVAQGAVFRFTQGLEAGINRILWGPDGALYVGGIGSGGNWGQTGKKRYGLQKLVYNGQPTFEMLAVRAKADGMELQFTEALGEGEGIGTADYEVKQWRYVPTEQYGGPKIDEQTLPVKSVSLSGDRKRVYLEIPGLKAGHVVYIRVHDSVRSASGKRQWATEAWYTLNAIPASKLARTGQFTELVALGEAEKRAGFRLLFDGKSLSQWRGFKRETPPAGWMASRGELQYLTGIEGGDLMTREMFGDFELRLDWRISEGGNSGIIWRATEDRDTPWMTGPEMQIIDDGENPNPFFSSGSDYELHEAKPELVRPQGDWNEIRLVAKGKNIQYWMNGVKTIEYTIGSDDWKARLARSKFNSMPGFAMNERGHIALQDHGHRVSYRNIRIRPL